MDSEEKIELIRSVFLILLHAEVSRPDRGIAQIGDAQLDKIEDLALKVAERLA